MRRREGREAQRTYERALSLFEKIVYIVGTFCFALCVSLFGSYYLIFLDVAFITDKILIFVLIGIDVVLEVVRYFLRRSYSANREEALVRAGIAPEDAAQPQQ